jgi:hypothetical protein
MYSTSVESPKDLHCCNSICEKIWMHLYLTTALSLVCAVCNYPCVTTFRTQNTNTKNCSCSAEDFALLTCITALS